MARPKHFHHTPLSGPSARRAKSWRPLTDGEAAMARQLFGDAIDYRRVRIYRRPYLPFRLQPRRCAMAPNGAIYFHPEHCQADFSAAELPLRHWFMHEMAHVWQHQRGYPLRLRGLLQFGLSYRYTLAPGADLADFNMEAQADLLADYFALVHLDAAWLMGPSGSGRSRADFDSVLARFLSNPSDPSLRPAWFSRAFRSPRIGA